LTVVSDEKTPDKKKHFKTGFIVTFSKTFKSSFFLNANLFLSLARIERNEKNHFPPEKKTTMKKQKDKIMGVLLLAVIFTGSLFFFIV